MLNGHIYYISPDTNHVGGSYSHFNLRLDKNGIMLGYFTKVISTYELKIERFFPGSFDVNISYLSISQQ